MNTPEAHPQDPRPIHERIAADLRDEILSGDLAPGTNLPSTTQLKDRFGASNATIQKAVQLLKHEQLVVGRPGSAVTVRSRRQRTFRPAAFMAPAAAGDPYPWLSQATAQGFHPSARLVDVAEVVPPVDVAAGLGIVEGGAAQLRTQILELDGEPVELVRCFYPLDIAQGTPLTERKKIKGGTPALLNTLGYPPRLSVDRVSARIPTQEEYTALRLPTSLPILRTLRVVYSDNNHPIEATVMAKAGHLYELQYEFTPE